MLLCNYVNAQNGRLTAHAVRLNQNNYVTSINPIDSENVWGLATHILFDTPTVNHYNNMQIVRSSDGGVHWQAFDIPGSRYTDSAEVANFWPVTDSTAYVAFYKTSAGYGGKIMKTTDGGSTWQTLNIGGNAYGNGGFLNFIYFYSPDTGIAVGDPQGGYFEIYTTTNGGSTWARVPQPDLPAPLTNETGTANMFTFSDNSVFFPTNSHRIIYSSDRGQTWQSDTNSFTNSNNIQANNNGEMVAQYDGFRYEFSADTASTTDTIDYPFVNNISISSPMRTKADNTLFSIGYRATSRGTYQGFIFECDSSPSVRANWHQVLSVDWLYYYFQLDPLNTRNYFYDQNHGWLPEQYNEYFDIGEEYTQVIYRFANCVATPVTLDLPDTVCHNATVDLTPYATPAGGSFFAYRIQGEITEFIPADFYSIIVNQDSVFNLQYVYENTEGCFSEAIQLVYITECESTGIEEADAENNQLVYPNPAVTHLYFSCGECGGGSISISNIQGCVLMEETIHAGGTDISQLAAGTYMATVKINSGLQTVRFLKQ